MEAKVQEAAAGSNCTRHVCMYVQASGFSGNVLNENGNETECGYENGKGRQTGIGRRTYMSLLQYG